MALSEKVLNTKDTKNTKGTKNTFLNTSAAKHGLEFGQEQVLAFRKVVFVPFVSFVFFVVLGAATQSEPRRIVSLVPALTEMLFAIGAGPQVVGVSSYDKFPADVQSLPRVGALLDPDTERILSLKPDLVITYGSQVDLQTQLQRASIATLDYRHGGLDHILVTLRQLGRRTGRMKEAETVATGIEARINAIKSRVAGKPRPRTLLVFSRDPRALRNIYVSGGSGFLHDMLVTAGGQDVFGDVKRESVQATTEIILARSPDVILEIRPDDIPAGKELDEEMATWARLASVPAVRNKRVYFITGQQMTVPGPRVVEGIERMVRALHPAAK
jgi:iron complex transport system substrate-binding protein